MKSVFVLVVLLAAATLLSNRAAAVQAQEDDPQQAALAAVQGTWERDLVENGQVVGRALKQIQGTSETVSYYDNQGQLLQSHKVDIQLRRQGRVRVFQHGPITVTGGPQKGQTTARGNAYVYKIQADRFFEIQGALLDQETEPVRVLVWQRAKEA